MKKAYPVIITEGKSHMLAQIPDFDITTQGTDTADTMFMARDAIGLMGIDMEDDGLPLPEPSSLCDLHPEKGIVTLVDVDFTEYRRKNENRSVKKNCTIPSWLNEKAEEAGLNFSGILQDALKKQLHITD